MDQQKVIERAAQVLFEWNTTHDQPHFVITGRRTSQRDPYEDIAAVLADACLLGEPYATEHLAMARRRIDIALVVEQYWREAALGWGGELMPGRVAAHPLACVRAALLGEDNPDHLGIPRLPGPLGAAPVGRVRD